MFVHGGGFTGGDKHLPGQFTNDNLMKWAVDQGMVGVSINYRLLPDHMLPDQLDDARDALASVANNVASYGGDPNRMFLGAIPPAPRWSASTSRIRPTTTSPGAGLLARS